METALMVMGGVVIGAAYALIQVAGEPAHDWRQGSVVSQPAMRHAARRAAVMKHPERTPNRMAAEPDAATSWANELPQTLAMTEMHGDQ